jgi:hypothetical protein
MAVSGREVFIDLEPDLRIRFRRSDAPPPISYAITLESLEDGSWTVVRLWDNADGIDQHHEHEHTRAAGKQAPRVHEFATVNEAMAAAIRKAKMNGEEIVRQWRT